MAKPSLKKLHKEAHNLIRLADKVDSYRRDLMSTEALGTLRREREALAQLCAKGQTPTPEDLERAMRRLDRAMRPVGGDIYPVTFISENVEMLLVAAILAIGIRTFFFQPFKIPTNSMYPTYAGMTPWVYNIEEPGPGLAERAWNFVTLGAINFNQTAPAGGEVLIPIELRTNGHITAAQLPSAPFRGRKWLGLLPAPKHRYTLFVNGQPVAFEVPIDFRLDDVVHQTYFPEYASLAEAAEAARSQGRLRQSGPNTYAIDTGVRLDRGQSVLDFDIRTGDMLFVDRVSYNFIRPRIGDPIVFRTQEIPGLRDSDTGAPAEQYYIKRLVGQAGDQLEVVEPTLLRNGEPITGAAAFDKNARREDGYAGYQAAWRLRPGETETVPEGYVYAMGDNSPDSYDSRGWGMKAQMENPRVIAGEEYVNFVPQKEVIGDAIFIFYPFSKRWGPAR